MLRTILRAGRGNDAKSERIARRHLSFDGLKKAVRRYFEPQTALPYRHACQVGDPVLRVPALPVVIEVIETPEFQRLIKHMTAVLRKYNAMGLSANQIGLSYQIFLMEVTKSHLEKFDESQRKSRQMELIPLRAFINPKIKVIDYATIKHREACLSVQGYSAIVPRAQKIQIEALNASGKPFVWNADGWAARIVQHEMDHLSGKLYVDRMDPSSFACSAWWLINKRQGDVAMRYYPRSRFRHYFLYR